MSAARGNPGGSILAFIMLVPLVIAVGWASWAASAWMRYGHAVAPAGGDPHIAALMPRYEVIEQHQRIVRSRAGLAFRAVRSFRLEDSAVIRGILRAREGIFARRHEDVPPVPLVQLAPRIGWALLDQVPGRELVYGAVAQPWHGDVRFDPLPRSRFVNFDKPGYAKIVWSVAVDSLGPAQSRVRTETRVITTDARSRSLFRRYWAVFSPGIVVIRYEALRTIGEGAERLALREADEGTARPSERRPNVPRTGR